MTQDPAHMPGGNTVSAGPASDTKTFVAATLLTFTAGMIVLVGYGLLGVFGGFLGIVGAVLGVVGWNKQHGKVFPRDLPGVSLISLGVIGVGAFVIVFLLS